MPAIEISTEDTKQKQQQDEEDAIRTRISSCFKDSMRKGDEAEVALYRLIVKAIEDREQEIGEGDAPGELADAEVTELLHRMYAQRWRSLHSAEINGRLALAEHERREMQIIARFLPRRLDEDDTSRLLDAIIDSLEARSVRDLGRCIKLLERNYNQVIDLARAGDLLRRKLTAGISNGGAQPQKSADACEIRQKKQRRGL